MTEFIMLTGCDGWDPDGPGEGKGTRIALSLHALYMFRDATEADLKKWPEEKDLGKDWRLPRAIVEHHTTVYAVQDTVGEIREKIMLAGAK